jgi:hypothetical protein
MVPPGHPKLFLSRVREAMTTNPKQSEFESGVTDGKVFLGESARG